MQPSFRPAETKAPETETKAPETKTNAPEAKTNAPEAKTKAPKAMTNAPESNTKALGCAAWCYNRANRRPLCLEGARQPGDGTRTAPLRQRGTRPERIARRRYGRSRTS